MDRWNTIWAHLKWMYERTSDRVLTEAAAAWYEANEPWALAGMQARVSRAIDKKEAQA